MNAKLKSVRVTITKDEYGEYRVPSPDGNEAGAYYTDDKDDAYLTAMHMYKNGKGYFVTCLIRKR